jgi:hypothetical protein
LCKQIEAIELSRRFDVDGLQSQRNRPRQLVGAFPNARKHDLSGFESAPQRQIDFTN